MASSTMKPHMANQLVEKVGKEMKKKLKMFEELDQSAVFTIRRSGASAASRKGSYVKIPNKKSYPSDDNPSPVSSKVSAIFTEKMNLYG